MIIQSSQFHNGHGKSILDWTAHPHSHESAMGPRSRVEHTTPLLSGNYLTQPTISPVRALQD